MTTIGLEVSVLMPFRVEIGTQVVVVLDQEVGLTDTDPEEVGLLAEEVVDLLVAVGIDIREAALTVLLLIHGSREQADITKHIGIVDRDEETMETTHRQTSDGTVRLVLLHTVGLLDEVHHIRKGRLERALHRLGLITRVVIRSMGMWGVGASFEQFR